MRALTSRDRHRDTRKAFVRHDTRTPSQRSVARCSKLGLQIDLESSTRIVISGVAEFRKRKLFVRMLMDEFSRFPDFYRLSAFQASGAELSDLICGCHLYHPASSNFNRDGDALPALAIARLILAEPKKLCVLL